MNRKTRRLVFKVNKTSKSNKRGEEKKLQKRRAKNKISRKQSKFNRKK